MFVIGTMKKNYKNKEKNLNKQTKKSNMYFTNKHKKKGKSNLNKNKPS